MVDAIDDDGYHQGNSSDNPGAITLITLHQAKGLEFDTVFISGVCEGLLPHSGLNFADSTEDHEAATGEERRLMYVGMTRAKRKLHITWPMFYRVPRMPSRFLEEIPMEYVKKAVQGRAAPPPVAFSSSFGDRG